MLFDKVIAYDHLKQKICIIVNMKTDRVMKIMERQLLKLRKSMHFLIIAAIFADSTVTSSIISDTNLFSYSDIIQTLF